MIGFALFFIVSALMLALVSWLSYLPRFAIQSVQVEGVRELSPEEVANATAAELDRAGFHLFSPRNVFLYRPERIEHALRMAFPRIKEVHVSASGLLEPDVVVSVAERVAAGVWCADSLQCYFLDGDGLIFARVEKPEEMEGIRIFYGGLPEDSPPIGLVFLPRYFQKAERLLDALGNISFPAHVFRVENEYDFEVVTDTGFVLYASFEQIPAEIVNNLQTVLEADALRGREADIEYIDLRFGERVYYRLDGAGE